jgi:hypothetical protein
MQLKKILVVSLHHTNFEEQAKCNAFESLGPQLDGEGKLTGWTLENVGAFFQRGWIMRLHPDAEQHDQSSFSAGLQEVVALALRNDAQYIHFDGVVETTPYIPEYRH